MKTIKLIFTLSLLFFCLSCDKGNDTQENKQISSKTIRLEANIEDGATEVIVGYEIRNTSIVLVKEEKINVTKNWTKTIEVTEPFNNVQLTVANTSFEGKVSAKAFVGDELVGSDISNTIAVISAFIP